MKGDNWREVSGGRGERRGWRPNGEREKIGKTGERKKRTFFRCTAPRREEGDKRVGGGQEGGRGKKGGGRKRYLSPVHPLVNENQIHLVIWFKIRDSSLYFFLHVEIVLVQL